MPALESRRPVSYTPCRFASGTFPVSKFYHLRQMLYNYAYSHDRVDPECNVSDQAMPAFPFSDVPVYADTVDMETLAFHNFWGCLLTPDNVAARIATDDLRYHAWVAAKRVVDSGRVHLADKQALIRAVMDQFMVELGLVLLDLCPGPLVLFVDPRLHDDASQMVARAVAMVAKLDDAHVRRWRIIVTLPATEAGICAARELTHQHAIQTNLSLVSCLAHAIACIDAGARMVSMSVAPIMEWFEQQPCGVRADYISQDHPGIEAIQSCATFIYHHGLNTTLLTTDVRTWTELKQLNGIGAAALRQAQLDQIPMKHVVTWYPQPGDQSPATCHALTTAYTPPPPNKGFLASLPADLVSMVSAVLYVRLGKMAAHMDTIEQVLWYETRKRIRLETTPLDKLYRRPTYANVPDDTPSAARRSLSLGRSRSTSRGRSRRNVQLQDPLPMVEGVDYF